MMMSAEELTEILRAARIAAEAAQGEGDGGTCNFDAATFIPPRGMRAEKIEAAAQAAGTRVHIRQWFGRRHVFLSVGRGQAVMNTRMEEAACKVLEAAGLNAHMYYQVD